MKKFKVLILALAIWQVLFSPAVLSLVFAQEASPTDTPIETPVESPAAVTGDVFAGSSTPEPSPTPSPEDLLNLEATDSALLVSPSPTLIPESITIDQSGTVSSNSLADSNSGQNTQTATHDAKLTTGDTTSIASDINVTNLSEVNSNLITTVQNIYTRDTEDLDLFQLLLDATATNPNIIPANTNIIVTQSADVATDTEAVSTSGENTQNAESTRLQTGNSTAVASAINAVNINLVGSNMVLAVINILEDYSGDIILPNGQAVSLAPLGLTNLAVNTNQTANVDSNTNVDANTRNNDQIGKSANLTTGDTTSTSNTNSFVNLVQIGGGLGYIIINNSGNWTGNLVNWTAPETTVALPQGTTVLINSWPEEDATGDGTINVTVNQSANVSTNVSAVSNTGDNAQNGEDLSMTTGNAFALSNNLTLANITGVGTNFFFGIINIFGNWTGNIFSGPKPPPVEPDPIPTNESFPDTRSPDLQIIVNNNVGAFVYPGDTVLADITVVNQGGVLAHDVKVKGHLTNDQSMPAIPMDWKIGDLKPGGKVKISFSITLTSNLPSGQYKISATATGNGESGNEGSAEGESSFWVKVKNMLTEIAAPEVLAESSIDTDEQILGTTNAKSALDINKYLPYILLGLIATYLLILIAQKKLRKNK